MLLSVLVVAQSISEIPAGLMNNPVLWDHSYICGPSLTETSLCGAYLHKPKTVFYIHVFWHKIPLPPWFFGKFTSRHGLTAGRIRSSTTQLWESQISYWDGHSCCYEGIEWQLVYCVHIVSYRIVSPGNTYFICDHLGHAVLQLFEVLRYRMEGRGFISWCCH